MAWMDAMVLLIPYGGWRRFFSLPHATQLPGGNKTKTKTKTKTWETQKLIFPRVGCQQAEAVEPQRTTFEASIERT